jgi:hypothetical protein
LVVSDDAGVLVLRSSFGRITRIAWRDVASLNVLKGKRNYAVEFGRDLGIVGLVFGGIYAHSEWEPCGEDDVCIPYLNSRSRGVDTAIGAVLGGAIGVSVGALIGTMIWADRWENVPIDRLRVTATPRRTGALNLGLSVAF